MAAAMLSSTAGCFKETDPLPPEPLVDSSDVLLDEEGAQNAAVDPDAEEMTVNKEVQVSIIGYHDFITGRAKNPMMINIDKFREQMQALKDAKVEVITFDDFFAWRRGEKEIHDPSVIITLDDGWRSSYRLAWPVLKEFGYPFTIYLYKNYVGGGGRALTVDMIKEMVADGVEIGSHTVSHPLRKSVFATPGKRTPEEFAEYLREELHESKLFLERTFGVPVRTFAYPGGMYNDEIVQLCEQYGYEAMITCNPARTTWDTSLGKLNRFIIHGNNELNFNAAMRFRQFSAMDTRVIKPLAVGEEAPEQTNQNDNEGKASVLVAVSPAPDSTVTNRFPVIEADLSKVEGEIDADSVSLQLSGLGECRFEYDPETRLVQFTPRQAIRREVNEVILHFNRAGEPKKTVVGWHFSIDLAAAYRPQEPQLQEPQLPSKEE